MAHRARVVDGDDLGEARAAALVLRDRTRRATLFDGRARVAARAHRASPPRIKSPPPRSRDVARERLDRPPRRSRAGTSPSTTRSLGESRRASAGDARGGRHVDVEGALLRARPSSAERALRRPRARPRRARPTTRTKARVGVVLGDGVRGGIVGYDAHCVAVKAGAGRLLADDSASSPAWSAIRLRSASSPSTSRWSVPDVSVDDRTTARRSMASCAAARAGAYRDSTRTSAAAPARSGTTSTGTPASAAAAAAADGVAARGDAVGDEHDARRGIGRYLGERAAHRRGEIRPVAGDRGPLRERGSAAPWSGSSSAASDPNATTASSSRGFMRFVAAARDVSTFSVASGTSSMLLLRSTATMTASRPVPSRIAAPAPARAAASAVTPSAASTPCARGPRRDNTRAAARTAPAARSQSGART